MQVFQALQLDFKQQRFITISGSNGKGSTQAFLAAIYQSAGYKVACFSSPHFLHYNERISIDGEPATDAAIISAFELIEQHRLHSFEQAISLTYFEFSLLAALIIFQRQQVDIIILETGMGGRLDAVNIIDTDCAIITAIGLDHQQYLGADINQIAIEKAGIMRANKPAIYSQKANITAVAKQMAAIGALGLVATVDFSFEVAQDKWHFFGGSKLPDVCDIPLPALAAVVQLENASGAVAAVQSMQNVLAVDNKAIKAGIKNAKLSARMQYLNQAGYRYILDVAHNPQAAQAVVDTICTKHALELKQAKFFIILGMLADKDAAQVVKILGQIASEFLLVTPHNERALPKEQLLKLTVGLGVKTTVYQNMAAAISAAQHKYKRANRAQNLRIIMCLGSFFTVADALQALKIRRITDL